MRAFVTGGSGFTGRALIRELVSRGDTVHAMARSDSSAALVEGLGAVAVRGDLSDARAMAQGMEGCDAAFHLAAFVEVWGSRETFLAANVEGTRNVVAACRSAAVPVLVHMSTEAVLVGGGPIVRADETRPRARKPIGLYPETKGLAEDLVLAANDGALRTTIVRPRFIWGVDDTSVLPQILEAVDAGQFAWIGGGTAMTSSCHVRNVVEGTILAAERGKGGDIYFLTDGVDQPMKQFMGAMIESTGRPAPTKSVPVWVAYIAALCCEAVWTLLPIRRPPPLVRSAVKLFGEEVTVVDTKAREGLGYTSAVTIEAGLAEMRAAGQP